MMGFIHVPEPGCRVLVLADGVFSRDVKAIASVVGRLLEVSDHVLIDMENGRYADTILGPTVCELYRSAIRMNKRLSVRGTIPEPLRGKVRNREDNFRCGDCADGQCVWFSPPSPTEKDSGFAEGLSRHEPPPLP